MYLPEIIPLIKDMARYKAKVDRFSFSYNRVTFDVLVFIDRIPFELLFGIVDKNATLVLKLHKGYHLEIP